MFIVWIVFKLFFFFVIFNCLVFFLSKPGAKLSSARRVGAPKGGAPKGGGPNPEKVEARRVGARRSGGPKISLFFFSLSRHNIRSFLPSLGVFSWNFGGV